MSLWPSRRSDPEPAAPEVPDYMPRPVAEEQIQRLPRLGRGVCWSEIVAEIAAEASRSDLPNPWSPEPPEPSGEAA